MNASSLTPSSPDTTKHVSNRKVIEETWRNIEQPPLSPSRRFDPETAKRRKPHEIPRNDKAEIADISAKCSQLVSPSKQLDELRKTLEKENRQANENAIRKALFRGNDVIAGLYFLATKNFLTTTNGEAQLNWNDLIKLVKNIATAKHRLEREHSTRSQADISTADFCRYRAIKWLDAITPEQRQAFIAGLGSLNFEIEIDEALCQIARHVLKNPEDPKALQKITSLLRPGSKNSEENIKKRIARMDEQQLVAFLKKEWLAVDYLRHFRIAILTEGIDCYSDVKDLPFDALAADWKNLFNNRQFERLIAERSKVCFNTLDIAELLEQRRQAIQSELILRILDGQDETKYEFDADNFILTFCSGSDFTARCDEWNASSQNQLEKQCTTLIRHGLIPKGTNPLLSKLVVVKLLAVKYLNEEQQQRLFESLSLDALCKLKYVDNILALDSRCTLQQDLDRLNLLIESGIATQLEGGEAHQIDRLLKEAREDAKGLAVARLGGALMAMAREKNQDGSATYSFIHRIAEAEYRKLIRQRLLAPLSENREEGADYGTILILLTFRYLLKLDEDLKRVYLKTIVSQLSIPQLRILAHSVPSDHDLNDEASIKEYGTIATILRTEIDQRSGSRNTGQIDKSEKAK